jgi:ABC-type glycerol-3-phosphate transport system permease component
MATRKESIAVPTSRPRKERKNWALSAFVFVIVIIIDMPIIMMLLNSLRTTEEILSSTSLFPENFTLSNFSYLTERTSFWSWFGNSIRVAVGGTIVTIVFASLAGYALSRFRGRALTAYSRLLLMVQMFPLILMLIPLFILFRELNLIDTRTSVIFLYSVVHLPFATWMFKAFFDSIPRDLEEAAQIDGSSRFGAFWRIVLRLSGPGVAAVTIFSFLFSYNEFLIASIFLRNEEKMTIPVGVQMFMQQYGSDWGSLMAASTLAMLPTLVFFLFVQKYMVYGAVAGAVKG